jgi:hypothetical protein
MWRPIISLVEGLGEFVNRKLTSHNAVSNALQGEWEPTNVIADNSEISIHLCAFFEHIR